VVALIRLTEFLRARQREILARWEAVVRALPSARADHAPDGPDAPIRPILGDRIPALLDHVAAVASGGPTPTIPALAQPGRRLDLVEVVTELGLLRDTVLALWQEQARGAMRVDELRVLDRTIDRAIAEAASELAATHNRILHERDLHLRVLADNIPQLAWMADADGRIFWVNHRWLQFTGVSASELQQGGWDRVHDPEHATAVRDRIAFAVRTGQPWESMHPMRGTDGRSRWFLCRGRPIRDDSGTIVRWLQTCTDVTERRFLDEATAVLASTLDYRDTLDRLTRLAVPEIADWCAVDLNVDDRIRRVAVAHHDPVKLEIARAYVERHPDAHAAVVRDVIATGEPTFIPVLSAEQLARSVQDPEHRAHVTRLGLHSVIIVPLTARGRALGAITLAMSESPRTYHQADVEVALELGRRAGIAVDNARLYHDAQEAVRVREDVLAIVSHDLRNPLGAIDLSATMMMQRATDPRARKQLEIIRRSTTRMEHMITDLLDMASIQAGRLVLDKTPQDAARLVADAVEMHASLAAEKQIVLTADTVLEGVTVMCDRERIGQVFGNLLSNSIKFCKPGDDISITGRRSGAHVVFVLADTGPGIAPDELPHIFEPYWSARRHAKQGTGLGLYISKGIVDAHHGTIDVASQLGAGATFTITLPLA
jgi:PAS domain S-box-containing protein